jgi:hypothetical protein
MSGVNYSPNPSAEVDLSSYAFSGCTATRDTFVQPGSGNYSIKCVATGGSAMFVTHTITGLTIGQRYNASFFTYAATPFEIGCSVGVYPGITSKGASGYWVRPWVAFTAITTSVSLIIGSLTSNTAGDTMWVDLVKVTDGEFAGPYFDGTYPFSSWSGTAHLSASTCTAFAATSSSGSDASESPVVANGLCLQTYAWNISQKSGRYMLPGVRGTNTQVPGMRGSSFVRNRPVNTGMWTLTMWVLGAFPDGSIPQWGETRRIFDRNYNQILKSVMSVSAPISLAAWQDDGTVRTATGQLGGSTESNLQMGGRRGEITLVFEILEGAWQDAVSRTIVGTAGSHWSNDVLDLSSLDGGSAPIDNSLITVHGPITNPRIFDPITNTWVQYNGTLGSSDSWVVDCAAFTSAVNGVGALINTQHYGHPRFLVIDPGTYGRKPSVTVTGSATGTNTNVTIQAARQHWGA